MTFVAWSVEQAWYLKLDSWVKIPTPSLTNGVISPIYLTVLSFPFPHVYNGDNNTETEVLF